VLNLFGVYAKNIYKCPTIFFNKIGIKKYKDEALLITYFNIDCLCSYIFQQAYKTKNVMARLLVYYTNQILPDLGVVYLTCSRENLISWQIVS